MLMAAENRERRPITSEDRALGARIRARREYLDLSQAQVALRMGKGTDKAVAHWESGYSRISAIELIELARVLRCSVSYLAGEEETLAMEDTQWFGHLGRSLDMIPEGKIRDAFKERLRTFAKDEAEFLRRMSESEPKQ